MQRSLEIKYINDTVGYGLFASRDFDLGQVVLCIKTPFAAVLATEKLEDTCAGCFRSASDEGRSAEGSQINVRACTGCKIVKYCDRTCQRKDWKLGHSLECPIYANLQPRILPVNVRAALRILLRFVSEKISPEEMELWKNLKSHIVEIRERSGEQWHRTVLSAKAVLEYSKEARERSAVPVTEEFVVESFAKMEVNTFNLTNAFNDRIGIYVHPYAALINHSCDYNAVVAFEGDQLSIKPLRPIKAGEQIYISYVDCTHPRDVRQKELLDRYFFTCECTKCQNAPTDPEDVFLVSNADEAAVSSAEQSARRQLEFAATATNHHVALRHLEEAVQELDATGVWPITRQPYPEIRDELFVTLLTVQQYHKALAHAIIRYRQVDPVLFPSPVHPTRRLHAWALVRLLTSIGDTSSEAVSVLQNLGVDMPLVLWSVLQWLAAHEKEACTPSLFQKTVKACQTELHKDFQAHGRDPSTMTKSDEDREWGKMDQFAKEILSNKG